MQGRGKRGGAGPGLAAVLKAEIGRRIEDILQMGKESNDRMVSPFFYQNP